jgi:hypothetical protein
MYFIYLIKLRLPAVSDGYFFMLKPLSRGVHEIRSTGSLVEVTVQGSQNFASDVIYHITIE